MCNPLVTWQRGDPICRSHFLSRSEERAALILDTLNAESCPPVPPPVADQLTLTEIDRHNSVRQQIRSLPPLVEADSSGGQSKYSLLPPVLVPHSSTTLASSALQSLPVVGVQLGPRCPCLIMRYPKGLPSCTPPPPGRTSLLPTAVVADNRHTPRYSLFPHVHVGWSPGVAPFASPQSSTVALRRWSVSVTVVITP